MRATALAPRGWAESWGEGGTGDRDATAMEVESGKAIWEQNKAHRRVMSLAVLGHSLQLLLGPVCRGARLAIAIRVRLGLWLVSELVFGSVYMGSKCVVSTSACRLCVSVNSQYVSQPACVCVHVFILVS